MKNIQCIPVYIAGILFFLVISCSKDATNGNAVLPPCTTCAPGSNPNPTLYWHSIQVTAVDWFVDTGGVTKCDIDPKVNALFPWNYGTYTYPKIAFNYGTSTMQIINQGDSVARNGGLFILDKSDIIFKSQTSSPPDTIYIAVYLQPE
jgi:hypothetical protein